jgi:hypothetical protein
MHDSGIKSFILFFQEACQVASPGRASLKDPMQLNATMAMQCEMLSIRAYVTLFCCVGHVTMRGEWSRIHLRGLDQTIT